MLLIKYNLLQATIPKKVSYLSVVVQVCNLVLVNLGQEDHRGIKASLGYIASSSPAWASEHTTISKDKKKERNKSKENHRHFYSWKPQLGKLSEIHAKNSFTNFGLRCLPPPPASSFPTLLPPPFSFYWANFYDLIHVCVHMHADRRRGRETERTEVIGNFME